MGHTNWEATSSGTPIEFIKIEPTLVPRTQMGNGASIIGTKKSSIFSTDIGLRPAEPCSLSVAATQQLLTQLLLYLMSFVGSKEGVMEIMGASYSSGDIRQLEKCNRDNIKTLELVTGVNRNRQRFESATCLELCQRGHYWAQHVLEVPRSWILGACYIFVTVRWYHFLARLGLHSR